MNGFDVTLTLILHPELTSGRCIHLISNCVSWTFKRAMPHDICNFVLSVIFQVSFCNFPRTLLCGEVHGVMLQLTNVGSSPLHKLQVTSTSPEYFTLGCHGQLCKFPCVYQTTLDLP